MLSCRSCLSSLLAILLLLPTAASAALAEVAYVWIDEAPTSPLGQQAMILAETGAELNIDAVRRLGGDFTPAGNAVPTFGIGAPPVWLRLIIDNPMHDPLPGAVLAGTSWVDRLDFYVVHDGQVVAHQRAGDRTAGDRRPIAGLGFLFAHEFSPGLSEVFLRAETPDPLLLPVRLMTPASVSSARQYTAYSYGLVYGFLLALLAYNLMLYAGLGQRSHLDYSVYLGFFALTNLAYTGHGYVWLWSDWPGFQRYVILLSMTLFACSGFRFASNFLGLSGYAPRVANGIRLLCFSVLVTQLLFVALDWQSAAALVAFSYVLFFSFAMLVLGWDGVRRARPAARYFLAAGCSGMAGIALTNLTVWGWIPFTQLGYRAVEVGVLIEATLLALAVAYQVRQHEAARYAAEHLARIDPLTGLLNRRALIEQGERQRITALRHGRDMALIMFDLDHFKFINDLHGHATGDRVLRETAAMLQQLCRREDLAARWGGEEFILIMPDADLHAARIMAERLREQLQQRKLWAGEVAIELCASFGVVALAAHGSIDGLIAEADSLLYQAKQSGRNRICYSTQSKEADLVAAR